MFTGKTEPSDSTSGSKDSDSTSTPVVVADNEVASTSNISIKVDDKVLSLEHAASAEEGKEFIDDLQQLVEGVKEEGEAKDGANDVGNLLAMAPAKAQEGCSLIQDKVTYWKEDASAELIVDGVAVSTFRLNAAGIEDLNNFLASVQENESYKGASDTVANSWLVEKITEFFDATPCAVSFPEENTKEVEPEKETTEVKNKFSNWWPFVKAEEKVADDTRGETEQSTKEVIAEEFRQSVQASNLEELAKENEILRSQLLELNKELSVKDNHLFSALGTLKTVSENFSSINQQLKQKVNAKRMNAKRMTSQSAV